MVKFTNCPDVKCLPTSYLSRAYTNTKWPARHVMLMHYTREIKTYKYTHSELLAPPMLLY